ncbi:unnamed protein product [Calypogeia fissa]
MLSCFFGGSQSAAFVCVSTACAGSNSMPKMPWGWGKSSSKEIRKGGGCRDVDGAEAPRGHHSAPVLRRAGERNKVESDSPPTSTRGPHRFSLDVTPQNSDPRSVFAIGTLCSRSPSPSTPSTRCPSFNDKKPPAQPLPLPAPLGKTYSGSGLPSASLSGNGKFTSVTSYQHHPSETAEQRIFAYDPSEVDQVTSGAASCSNNSSVSSLGSVEVVDSSWNHGVQTLSRLRPTSSDTDATEQIRSPALGSTTPKHSRKSSRQDSPLPTSPLGQTPSTSPKKSYAKPNRTLSPIRLEPPGGLRFQQPNGSAPDSSLSSPARSPRRVSSAEQAAYGGPWIRQDGLSTGSAQGSSPGSGPNSGHNSSGGDPAQMLWGSNPSRRSPEPSPIPSPRQRSPGPSGTVSPLQTRSHGSHGMGPSGSEMPTSWHEDGKTSAHPLPLPPPRGPTGGSTLHSPSISPTPSPTPGREISRNDSSFGSCHSSLGSSVTKWQKGKLIGSGTFGNVYVVFNSDSGALRAMKEVLLVSDDSKSKESVKQLGQEIAVLSRLRHPNIVQYIGTEALDDRLCIYLEYVSGGSIHKLLQEYGSFKEPVIRSFTRQILCGLAYLHNMNTVHRDVKGANILVDTNGKVKLADFGMAKHITAQSFPLSFKGSPYWMAPEVIKHTNGYDLAVDIWSLGCTVLEMATAKPPWSQYEGVAAMFKIGNSKELPSIPDTMSPEGKEFVRLCLQRDPNLRPTAQQLLKHPFVENLQDDRYDGSDVMAATTAGIRNLTLGPRHDLDVGISFPPPLSRTRGQLSPTSSDLSRNISSGYLPSNQNSLSPTGQSRRHVYNGLNSLPHSPRVQSGASTPHTGGYGSPHSSGHGSAPGSAHGIPHTHAYPNGTYGALPGPYADGYANVSRQNGIYGNTLMNGGYTEPVRSEFHWGTPHWTPEGSPLRRDIAPHENDILGLALGRVSQDSEEDTRRHFNVNGNLVEHVSQQLLRRPKQLSPILYHHRSSTSPSLSRTNSELSH